MILKSLSFFFTFLLYSNGSNSKKPLNEFIGHYETLDYNSNILHQAHLRTKRSPKEANIHLRFTAHDREFNLNLTPDLSTFSPDVRHIESDGRLTPLDTSHIYQGVIENEVDSYVHGSIISGIFSGRIDSSLDKRSYYVDKSEIYFSNLMPFHSVIYTDDSVIHPNRVKRDLFSQNNFNDTDHGCGLIDPKILQWMNNVQNSAVDNQKSSNHENRQHNIYSSQYNSQPINDDAKPIENIKNGSPFKRKTRSANLNSQNRMCALFLQSDPMLWDYMTRSPLEKTGGLAYSAERAREEITSLFASHVDGIKKIYSQTVFKYQDAGPFKGFTFAVHRVQINTSSDCRSTSHRYENAFCKPNVDVSNFLNLNSLSNHDLYCLAYVFTYRDFSQGTLGLAWVGSYLRASGGLCERWKQYNENNRMIHKSLNTGIVTLVNYGTRVPPKVSTLTFAHEVGHNFGSPHDSGETCVPSLRNSNHAPGNYIMFASATSGDKSNNHDFSPCSIGNITLVLDAVLHEQNGKDNCFVRSQEAFCGNRIVEAPEEQCDCGFLSDCRDQEHSDRCCYEQEHPKHCTRKENATCSPSEGPCCVSSTCSFIPGHVAFMCLQEKECAEASYCTGTGAKCPHPKPKPDLTLCNQKTQICRNGDCTGSICERIGWEVCSIEAPIEEDKTFDRGQLCYISCLHPKTEKCISTGNLADISEPENVKLLQLLESISTREDGIRMPAGAPCDNYRGYCDVFQKCRAVNEDGPLARLKNLLFNQRTISQVKLWIIAHWWAVGLMGLGLVIFMGLFIKCCAVHTPSSNPMQPAARKISIPTLPRRHHQRPPGPLGPPPPYSPTPCVSNINASRPQAMPQQGKRRSNPQRSNNRRDRDSIDIEIRPLQHR